MELSSFTRFLVNQNKLIFFYRGVEEALVIGLEAGIDPIIVFTKGHSVLIGHNLDPSVVQVGRVYFFFSGRTKYQMQITVTIKNSTNNNI